MTIRKTIVSFLLAALMGAAGIASASDNTAVHSVGVHGYDLVTYQTEGRPVPGSGHYVAVHGGTTYLFASAANQKAFQANPGNYLPAYGGYCAYGVSVGKKFDGDPLVWKIVDGTLYLNLDKDIQATWKQDIPGNIRKASNNWPQIKTIHPQEL